MKTFKLFSASALALTAALTMTGCQEYEPFGLEEMTKAEFTKNFFKEYGQFPKNMSWDFSSRTRTSKTDASVFGYDYSSQTRAVAPFFDEPGCRVATDAEVGEVCEKKDGYYEVEYGEEGDLTKTLSWLRQNLQEGQNNTALGNPFVFHCNGPFAIMPIYQGNAAMVWDLHLVCNGVDYRIWHKNEGLEIRARQENRIAKDNLKSGTWKLKQEGGLFRRAKTDAVYSEWENMDVSDADWLYDIRLDFNNDTYNLIAADDAPYGIYVGEDVTVLQPSKYILSYTEKTHSFHCDLGADNSWGYSTTANSGDAKGSIKLKGPSIQAFPIITMDEAWTSEVVEYKVLDLTSNSMTLTLENADQTVQWKYVFEHEDTYFNWDQIGAHPHKVHTMDYGYDVRSHPMVLNMPNDSQFYFYLEIMSNGDNYCESGTNGSHMRSTEGMMLAIPCPTPENLKTNVTANQSLFGDDFNHPLTQVMVIGCEDSDKTGVGGSDWDINDVVFLCIGLDQLPSMRDTFTKRYFIEDLGNTYDFDFNDIVVDVSEQMDKNFSGSNDGNEWSAGNVYSQIASIKHLCGTFPFKVKFVSDANHDGIEFPGLYGQINYDPDPNDPKYKKEVVCTGGKKPFWNAATHNIQVDVIQDGGKWNDADPTATSGNTVYTITFPQVPKESEELPAPLMIAVDENTPWTEEGVMIDKDWFYWDVNLFDDRKYKVNGSDYVNSTGFTKSFDQALTMWNEAIISFTSDDFKLEEGEYEFTVTVVTDVDMPKLSVKFYGDGGTEGSDDSPWRFNNKITQAGTYQWTRPLTVNATNAAKNLEFEFYPAQTSGAGSITIKNIKILKHGN